VAPSRAEVEKARRTGRAESARTWLAREVRVAAAGSTSREEFAQTLTAGGDVVIEWRESIRSPGEFTGYRVGRSGDVDAGGKQVWFSGSKLSPDLSLQKLQARWLEAAGVGTTAVPRPRAPLTIEQRQEVLARADHALARVAHQPVTTAAAVSAGEVATTLARVVEGPNGGHLTAAADELARAVRQPRGVRPDTRARVHDLRLVAAELSLLGHVLPREADHVLVLTAHVARIADAVARMRGRADATVLDVRMRSARRAVARYTRHAGPIEERQVHQARRVLGPDLAVQVARDPAWPALAAQMRRIEEAGDDPGAVLAQVARVRELASARSAAAVLHHRSLQSSATAAEINRPPGRGHPASSSRGAVDVPGRSWQTSRRSR